LKAIGVSYRIKRPAREGGPVMQGLALWWCQLFGYVTCSQVSTFEAIFLAGSVLVAVSLVLGIIAAALGN